MITEIQNKKILKIYDKNKQRIYFKKIILLFVLFSIVFTMVFSKF